MTGRLYGQRERDREREKEKKEREVMGLRDRKVIWIKREREIERETLDTSHLKCKG